MPHLKIKDIQIDVFGLKSILVHFCFLMLNHHFTIDIALVWSPVYIYIVRLLIFGCFPTLYVSLMRTLIHLNSIQELIMIGPPFLNIIN